MSNETISDDDLIDLDAIEARWKATSRHEGAWAVFDGDTPAIVTKVRTVADVYGHGDVEFIAHAHQDVPALVAEVRRLRAEREHIDESVKGIQLLDGTNYLHDRVRFASNAANEVVRGQSARMVELRGEVRRQAARIEALEVIARGVVDRAPCVWRGPEQGPHWRQCTWCKVIGSKAMPGEQPGDVTHKPDCPWLLAREAMAE